MFFCLLSWGFNLISLDKADSWVLNMYRQDALIWPWKRDNFVTSGILFYLLSTHHVIYLFGVIANGKHDGLLNHWTIYPGRPFLSLRLLISFGLYMYLTFPTARSIWVFFKLRRRKRKHNNYVLSVPFLGYRQTVQTQIRHRKTWCLIRVFTVC